MGLSVHQRLQPELCNRAKYHASTHVCYPTCRVRAAPSWLIPHPSIRQKGGAPAQVPRIRAASNSFSNSSGSAPGSNSLSQAISTAITFVQAQYLPLALTTALVIGCIAPHLGVAASKYNISVIVTTCIFILQGLSLKRGEAIKALQSTDCVLYGLASILLLTPLLGFLAIQAPLQPPELAVGLAVFCCMPTALSSGVTFTMQVGGNVALALLLTVSSNVLAIFTMPFMLSMLLGNAAGGVQLSPWPLLQQLVQTILLPMAVGASIRGFVPGAQEFIDNNKKNVSYANSTLLALVPWIQVSKAVAQKAPLEPLYVLAAGLLGICIHLAFLALNITACRVLHLGGKDPVAMRQLRQALILTASVKTLPVAVTVLGKLGSVMGDMVGVAVVPCVLAHLGQILVDAALVTRWKEQQLQQ